MSCFRKKPIVVQATQWFKNGDHPEDGPADKEGKVVRAYRNPDDDGQRQCQHCGHIMHDHGWIDTLQGGHTVCPGDWIIEEISDGWYPCKPDSFEATYEPIECSECLSSTFCVSSEMYKPEEWESDVFICQWESYIP